MRPTDKLVQRSTDKLVQRSAPKGGMRSAANRDRPVAPASPLRTQRTMRWERPRRSHPSGPRHGGRRGPRMNCSHAPNEGTPGAHTLLDPASPAIFSARPVVLGLRARAWHLPTSSPRRLPPRRRRVSRPRGVKVNGHHHGSSGYARFGSFCVEIGRFSTRKRSTLAVGPLSAAAARSSRAGLRRAKPVSR